MERLVRQRFDTLYTSGEDRADAYINENCDWLVAAACGAHDVQNAIRLSVNEDVSESG